MIFETKSGVYWPIDDPAVEAMESYGFCPPLDWQGYEALCVFMREDRKEAIELWEPDNPFSLPNPSNAVR